MPAGINIGFTGNSRWLSAGKRGRADADYTGLVSARGEAPWSDRMLVLARNIKLPRPYPSGIGNSRSRGLSADKRGRADAG